MLSITVTGCGIMGSALVKAFMNAGYELSIVDLNEDAAKAFVENGAKYYKSLSEALNSDLIVMNLPNSTITSSVICNCPDGSLAGKTIINTNTATPTEVTEMEAIAKRAGARYLDAKIECYPQEIGTEAAFLVYSGDKGVFDENQQVLTALSKEPVFLGENTTAASILDLGLVIGVHNGTFFSLLEGTALAIKHGYPIPDFIEQLKTFQPALIEVVTRQINDAFAKFTGEYKDADEASLEIEKAALELVIKAMKQSGLNPAFSERMLEMMQSTVDQGYGNKNFVSVMSQIMK